MRRVLLVAVLLAPAACTDKSPATPAPATVTNLAGTWTGPITVEDQAARMTWTLSQTGSAVSGPVLISLTTGTVLLNGFLTGTVTGDSLAFTISVGPGGIPRQPNCVGQLTGTMRATFAATSTLTGSMTVSASSCTVAIPSATITLTRG